MTKFWLRDLDSPCIGFRCTRRATKEVVGPGNATYGRFCARCAERKRKELERAYP